MKKLLSPKKSNEIINFIYEEVKKQEIIDRKFPIKIRFSVEYVAK